MTEAREGMTEESLVALNRDLPNKDAVLELLAQMFTDAGRAADSERILVGLRAREEEVSTAMGFGFAIPHTKSAAASRASVAYLELNQAIRWSDEQVGQVLSIIVPEDGADAHLNILAKLARKLIDEDFRDRLSSAETSAEVVELLDT
ncbi:MAG TPA: PTS sugar transporter subunit IIA [Candidatus Agrococcus pullicola]|uniref:PTS sugar transporter subunit IIA n=1 Tax=Candidatus Agrococcus pullicola TaxID=2838429 RepID=A0A9D1YWQ5_9MICO|nr:PTS sugar transporter subunit IIA [Candidatus Agrococcus pullicola]